MVGLSTPSHTASPSPGLPAHIRPWAAVWSMLIGFFMLMIDSTIVSVANPSIQAGLRTPLEQCSPEPGW